MPSTTDLCQVRVANSYLWSWPLQVFRGRANAWLAEKPAGAPWGYAFAAPSLGAMVLSKHIGATRSGCSTPSTTAPSCATLSEDILNAALSSGDEEEDVDDPSFYDVTVAYVETLQFAVVKVCKTCCHCSYLSLCLRFSFHASIISTAFAIVYGVVKDLV